MCLAFIADSALVLHCRAPISFTATFDERTFDRQCSEIAKSSLGGKWTIVCVQRT